jgi:hypothetical protein
MDISRTQTERRPASALRAAFALLLVVGAGLLVVVGGSGAAQAAPDPKVVVCKYVGTPPGTLHHIVIVSENSLNNTPYVAPPDGDSWTDAHGQTGEGSVAIRYAAAGEQAKDVALSECPGATSPTPTPTPTDACPNLPGDQPAGFACAMEPEVAVVLEDDLTCTEYLTREITTTTPYEFVDGAWVLGEPETVTGEWESVPATAEQIASLGDECIAGTSTAVPSPDGEEPDVDADDEPTVLGTQAAVPTAVAAGSAGDDSGSGLGGLLGLMGAALLALAMVAGRTLRPRKSGAHQA